MKIEKLIEELQAIQKIKPGAIVKLNGLDGCEALFAITLAKNDKTTPEEDNIVWIECKDDIDMGAELSAQFEHAVEAQVDELDFYMNLLDTGFTLEDIKTYCGDECYEHSKAFMLEHGLI